MALSRPKHGFESRWGRQPSLAGFAKRASAGQASLRSRIQAKAHERVASRERLPDRRRLSRRSAIAKAPREGGLSLTAPCASAEQSLTRATHQTGEGCKFCHLTPVPNAQILRFDQHSLEHALEIIDSFRWRLDCLGPRMSEINRFVYVLRSQVNPSRHYSGIASNVRRRVDTHNSCGSQHTAQFRPWYMVAAVEFSSQDSAVRFERYLKSGSGRAFAKRHFT